MAVVTFIKDKERKEDRNIYKRQKKDRMAVAAISTKNEDRKKSSDSSDNDIYKGWRKKKRW